MGFLTDGSTLTWQQIQSPLHVILAAAAAGADDATTTAAAAAAANNNHHDAASRSTVAHKILTDGVLQFLSIWRKNKERANDPFLWGDEVEYIVVVFDTDSKTARLCLRASDILATLQAQESDERFAHLAHWAPEYGSFMIEGTPASPYSGLLDVEHSMRLRRKLVEDLLAPNERILGVASFPLMGVGQFTEPFYPPTGPIARSLYVPDEIINPHRRFGTLTANIRERRGSNVEILLPIFPDSATAGDELRPYANHVHLDAMGFGMGCCCLQCTFQAKNIDDARYLYDQFVVISPILLALSAACPIARGYLVDTDVRWHIIAGAVDDRTPEERGVVPSDKPLIPKSRYESVSLYISNDARLKDEYNDLQALYNHDAFATLTEAGVDARLAMHIAHLFIRDPLVIYSNKIDLDNELYTDHFENLQSTNWQTVRFKPPPSGGKIGWRVEFRVIEAQLTEFANAAFATFVALLNRFITERRPDFYIPLSKVDANMQTAKRRDAARQGSFYFRNRTSDSSDTSYELKSTNEILNGVEGGFAGLIPLVREYLDSLALPQEDAQRLHRYLRFLSLRASGELITVATWMRNFVQTHPKYKHDSVVSDEIGFDLLRACDDITHGRLHVPELVGDLSQ